MMNTKSQIFMFDLILAFTMLIVTVGFVLLYLPADNPNEDMADMLESISVRLVEKFSMTHVNDLGPAIYEFRVLGKIQDYDNSVLKQIAEFVYKGQVEDAVNLAQNVTFIFKNDLKKYAYEIKLVSAEKSYDYSETKIENTYGVQFFGAVVDMADERDLYVVGSNLIGGGGSVFACDSSTCHDTGLLPNVQWGNPGDHDLDISGDGSKFLFGADMDDSGGRVVLCDVSSLSSIDCSDVSLPGEVQLGDYFGAGVAMSLTGAKFVVGEPFNDKIYLYEEDGGAYSYEVYEPDEPNGYLGDSVDMMYDGDMFLVGDWGYDMSKGGVFLYEWNGSDYEYSIYQPAGLSANDNFGYSVSMSGDGSRFVVSAIGEDSSQGAVYLYEWNGADYEYTRYQPAGLSGNDKFGYEVDMASDGLSFVVGTPSSSYNGSAYYYYYNETADDYNYVEYHSDDMVQSMNGYGVDVAINSVGDRFMVGAFNQDGGTFGGVFEYLGLNEVLLDSDYKYTRDEANVVVSKKRTVIGFINSTNYYGPYDLEVEVWSR